jgi:hypothetical protein
MHTLHDLLLQGNILPSRGPSHPQPAPLASQVVVSPYVIDWVEGFCDLAFSTSDSHVLPCGVPYSLSPLAKKDFTGKKIPPPTFSTSPFVCLPKRLSSNRRTHTLHHLLLLQGHILPSWGRRHPRPAPLVSQVVLSQMSLVRPHLFLMSCIVDLSCISLSKTKA